MKRLRYLLKHRQYKDEYAKCLLKSTKAEITIAIIAPAEIPNLKSAKRAATCPQAAKRPNSSNEGGTPGGHVQNGPFQKSAHTSGAEHKLGILAHVGKFGQPGFTLILDPTRK